MSVMTALKNLLQKVGGEGWHAVSHRLGDQRAKGASPAGSQRGARDGAQ